MDNKKLETQEARDKAIKEFLKKPANKKVSERIRKVQQYIDNIEKDGIEENLFNLRSCLYALYIWKCITWAKNEANPSVYPNMDEDLVIQLIEDEDVDWEYYKDFIDTSASFYDDDNRLLFDNCLFIKEFDSRAIELIKAIFLLDYIFKSSNPEFNIYFGRRLVFEYPFPHSKFIFSKFPKEIWDEMDTYNMYNFSDLIVSPVTSIGIVIRYQDIPESVLTTIPAGLKISKRINTPGLDQKSMLKKEEINQQFDYEQRINSDNLGDKFTVHLKNPNNKCTNLLDNFDYYLKAFDIKTFNTKPEEMDALLDFDLNTMDISSYIPENYKKSYDILIKLITKFANSNKKGK